MSSKQGDLSQRGSRRLPKEDRRRQLLDVALRIVRDDGADALTLGHLAACAGVSKPVAYDHFGTRSGLLIDLYRSIDVKRVEAFRDAMSESKHGTARTVVLLATAYIDCAADTTHVFHKVGAALAGSAEKATVFQELLDHSVQMFVAVLTQHSPLSKTDLERRCIGLVGAGEALSAAYARGSCSRNEGVAAFASIIQGIMDIP